MPSPHLAAWEREFWSTVLEYDDDHDYLLDDHQELHDNDHANNAECPPTWLHREDDDDHHEDEEEGE